MATSSLFEKKHLSGSQRGVLGALEPRNFCRGLGAQGLLLLGARTKMMILAKWSLKVKPRSPRTPIFLLEPWRPKFFKLQVQTPQDDLNS